MWWCASELYLQVTLLCGRMAALCCWIEIIYDYDMWSHIYGGLLVVWLRRAHFACMFICSVITIFFVFADKCCTVRIVVCGVMCDDIWKKKKRITLDWLALCFYETWVGRNFYRICCALLLCFKQNMWKYLTKADLAMFAFINQRTFQFNSGFTHRIKWLIEIIKLEN